MNITRKQALAIAVIVLAGVLGSAALLLSDRPKAPAGDAAHTGSAADRHAADPGENAAPGRLKLTDAQLAAAGVSLATAGPATLRARAEFPGEIHFNDDRTAHVVPRLAGVAEAVPADLGQAVKAGQVLAVLASSALSELRSELLTARQRQTLARSTHDREQTLWRDRISAEQDLLQAQSALQEADIAVRNATQKLAAVGAAGASAGLNRFEIRAPFAGMLVEKHISLGESVREDTRIFTVSDLGSVWAEFAIAPRDLAGVRVGQRVIVASTAFDGQAEGTISYVGALLGEQTRTARARVVLDNRDGAWRPGLFVTVAVLGDAREAAVAVAADAVQTVDGQPTLFVAVPGGVMAKAVKVGERDGRTVEILGGLVAGERYAATHTFVLKSELGKADAGHGH